MSDALLTRRDALAGVAALAGTTSAWAAGSPAPRPNIVWLVSEDNNPFIGAYGDALARTPTIDRLAAEGILYRHVFSNAPVCAPSRFGIITGVLPESCAPAQHMRARAKLPALLRGFPEYLREAGYYCTNNAKTDYNADLDPAQVWDASSPQAHWRHRPAGAPFFAVFNHMTTHESRVISGPTAGAVKPEQVRVPAYLPDVAEVREDIASYYNLMEKMDGELAAKLAELEQAGLLEDTIVFYYSDNGGVAPRSKRFCYDEGLRCSMVVRVPAKWAHLSPLAAGSQAQEPISFIDLAPTTLSLAGVRVPPHMQGRALLGAWPAAPEPFAFGMRNRMDERYDMVRTVCDGRYRYIRNYMPHRPHGQHLAYPWLLKGYQAWERLHLKGQLNAVQERFWGEKPYEEFYDLHADPDQVRNLVHAPAHRARVARMSNALDAHMLRINDNGFIPEGAPQEGYLQSRAEGAYPLARVMAVAALAACRQATDVAELQSMLGDPDAVIRHWAAQGLLMQGRQAAAAQADLERMMEADPLTQNRIVAAEALAHLGPSARAVELLGQWLEHSPQVAVQLQALNALTYVGPAARPLVPLLERVVAQTRSTLVKGAGHYLVAVLQGRYRPELKTFEAVGPIGQ